MASMQDIASAAEQAARDAVLGIVDPINFSGMRSSSSGKAAGQGVGSVGAGVGAGAGQFGAGFATGLGQSFRQDPIDTSIGFGVIGLFTAAAVTVAWALNKLTSRGSYGGY